MLVDHIAKTDKISFLTKAETLHQLQNRLTNAHILPLEFFTVSEWKTNPDLVISALRRHKWFKESIVVRSSALGEDSQESSHAGCFTSVVNVQGEDAFSQAVIAVIASYPDDHQNHQILVQPYLEHVKLSGVAFSRDPHTAGSYFIINYDDASGDTTTVTSGQSNQKCYVHHYHSPYPLPIHLRQIESLLIELGDLFSTTNLDIEFASNQKNELFLLQARPLTHQSTASVPLDVHTNSIARIAEKIKLNMTAHPYLYGKQTVYGVMPDWNPAEIIGIRPKPLALSLYRELVTDSIWAYQRDNYGYANLRSFPLLVDFEGLPYIDVRVSFNSFLPKNLEPSLAERLVNYYLDQLIKNPTLHDKVEFDIVFSCYTLDLRERLSNLNQHGFNENDKETLFQALVGTTNLIIHNQNGLWKKDLEKTHELVRRQQLLFQSDLDDISKMYWILEDCKRYGTLPFVGLARAGFIAIQILKSFVAVGIINEHEYTNFIASVNSVSSNMSVDFRELSKESFLEKYGHLRPGTYDIMSNRYDEAPDVYFDWQQQHTDIEESKAIPFALTISQLRQIQESIERDGLEITALELLEFIKTAIESREYSKFIFSRSVSEFLRLCALYANQFGISREDCAYIHLNTLMTLYSSSIDPAEALHKSIAVGKNLHQMTSSITLPPLITQPSQAWSFELPETTPNFITQKSAIGHVSFSHSSKEILQNSILFIPSADPGYDWIFSHKIAGFVTQYGGVNSHMAIRAGELGIPAIIGAGEVKFTQWKQANKLHIDCLNKQVHLL